MTNNKNAASVLRQRLGQRAGYPSLAANGDVSRTRASHDHILQLILF